MKKLLVILFVCVSSYSFSQSNWEGFGLGLSGSGIRSFYEDTLNDKLIVGGAFGSIDTFQNNGIAVWDGENWGCFSNGLLSGGMQIFSIIEYLDTLYVGGWFWGGIGNNDTLAYIAKWDGTKWLNSGINSNDVAIVNMRVINNELYIIGGFDSINDFAANGLAKYNGLEWSSVFDLPQFFSTSQNLLNDVAYYKGELYVGGNFVKDDLTIRDIVKYNGTEWVDVGGSLKGGSSNVNRMLIYDNELVVAGTFYKSDGNVGNNIMTWDGTEWQELGDFVETNSSIKDMKIADSCLYIGGTFSTVSNLPIQSIAIWDGQRICGLGGDFGLNVYSLGFYRDTLFVGCGNYVDSIQVNRLVHWNGGNYIDTCSIPQNVFEFENDKPELNIYPNPTSGIIRVEAEGIESIEFFDIYGRNLQGFQNLEGLKCELDLSTQPKGIYIIKVQTSRGVAIEKVILQ